MPTQLLIIDINSDGSSSMMNGTKEVRNIKRLLFTMWKSIVRLCYYINALKYHYGISKGGSPRSDRSSFHISILFPLNFIFYQLLRVQHSSSSTQSWGSVLPSIVETRDQNSWGCPLLFSNRNLMSFCA